MSCLRNCILCAFMGRHFERKFAACPGQVRSTPLTQVDRVCLEPQPLLSLMKTLRGVVPFDARPWASLQDGAR